MVVLVLCSSISEHVGVFAQFYLEGQFPVYNEETLSSGVKQTHKPLCHAVKREVELKEDDYEYLPTSYTEHICTNPKKSNSNIVSNDDHMCTFPGFECVQRMKSLMVAKRKKGAESWEFRKVTVAADCDCMLPTVDLPLEDFPAF